MPDSTSASGPGRIVDAACDRFEDGWRAGRPEPLEDVVRDAPEWAREELFRELLALEIDYRGRAGRPLDRAEFDARFAGLGPWAAGAAAALAAGPAVALEATAGPYAGRTFALSGHATFTVGRRPGLPLSLPDDPYLSRVHCVVESNPPLLRVVDLRSASGTFVNGRRVDEQDLKDGDVVRVGGTEFRVRQAAGADVTLDLQGGGSSRRVEDGPPPIPGYQLGEELGRGAMGVVYRATDAATGEAVAVKTLLPAAAPTRAALGRFAREADILRRLDHPNIVGFRAAGAAGGALYVVMEYVPGRSAADVVRAGGPLAAARVLGWAGAFLDALAHAHDRGYVHRDLKPGNLLVVDRPGGEDVKVADFGLARAYEATSCSGLTVANASGGTPSFMPPEQVTDFRSVRPAADQYAAAATLYHLLTGSGVYEKAGSVQEMLRRILVEDPIPLRAGAPPLPVPFDRVLRRALERDPAARFPDVRSMRRALLGC